MEKLSKIDKRGVIDFLLPLLVLLSVILVMVVFVAFSVFIYGKSAVLGGDRDVIFYEEDEKLNEELFRYHFHRFLSSEILVDDDYVEVIDVLTGSLDPYFDLEVGDKNFVEKFGLDVLSEHEFLRDKLSDEDYSKFIEIYSDFDNSRALRNIREELNSICEMNKRDRFSLVIPQGVVEAGGLKPVSGVYKNPDVFTETFKNIEYRGQEFKIRLIMYNECIKKIKEVEVY